VFFSFVFNILFCYVICIVFVLLRVCFVCLSLSLFCCVFRVLHVFVVLAWLGLRLRCWLLLVSLLASLLAAFGFAVGRFWLQFWRTQVDPPSPPNLPITHKVALSVDINRLHIRHFVFYLHHLLS